MTCCLDRTLIMTWTLNRQNTIRDMNVFSRQTTSHNMNRTEHCVWHERVYLTEYCSDLNVLNRQNTIHDMNVLSRQNTIHDMNVLNRQNTTRDLTVACWSDRCLQNTTVVLLGDSNQRLWWRKITTFFLNCTYTHSTGKWHSPRLCQVSQLNSKVSMEDSHLVSVR